MPADNDADPDLFKERILRKLAVAREESAELVSSLGASTLNGLICALSW